MANASRKALSRSTETLTTAPWSQLAYRRLDRGDALEDARLEHQVGKLDIEMIL